MPGRGWREVAGGGGHGACGMGCIGLHRVAARVQTSRAWPSLVPTQRKVALSHRRTLRS